MLEMAILDFLTIKIAMILPFLLISKYHTHKILRYIVGCSGAESSAIGIATPDTFYVNYPKVQHFCTFI